jgi:hypothetical protein
MLLKVTAMTDIDSRLLECDGKPEMTEDFNRVLAMLDALADRVEALETQAGT